MIKVLKSFYNNPTRLAKLLQKAYKMFFAGIDNVSDSTSKRFKQHIRKILTGAHNVSDNSAEVSVCLTRIAFLGQY